MAFVIILTLIGVVLMLCEIFLVPGVGFAGILGFIAQVGACVYAFNVFGEVAGVIVTVINVALIIGFMVVALRAKTWKRATLNTKIDSKVMENPETMLAVGDKGKTVTRLSPMGTARIEGKSYEVKSLEGMLDSGVDIEVALIEDNKIIVKPIYKEF